jgi:hypothetical protein
MTPIPPPTLKEGDINWLRILIDIPPLTKVGERRGKDG